MVISSKYRIPIFRLLYSSSHFLVPKFNSLQAQTISQLFSTVFSVAILSYNGILSLQMFQRSFMSSTFRLYKIIFIRSFSLRAPYLTYNAFQVTDLLEKNILQSSQRWHIIARCCDNKRHPWAEECRWCCSFYQALLIS